MRKLIVAMLLIITMVSTCSLAIAKEYVVNTKNEPLNVRAAPRGEVIGTVRKGSLINSIDENSEWAMIIYNGRTGYVYKQYLSEVDKPVVDKKTGIPTVSGVPRYLTPDNGELFQVVTDKGPLNVRKGPSRQDDISVRVRNGGYVNVLSIKNGWAYVIYDYAKANAKGYVKTEFLVPVAVDYD